MAKRNKYIQRALDSLNLSYDNSNHEFELNTVNDLEFIISSKKSLIAECEGNIESMKECIEQLNKELQICDDLKHQVKVEEYKELNPNARVF